MVKVVVIEDDDAIRALVSSVLGDAGHEVTAVSSASDPALPVIADVVVTDLLGALPGSYEPDAARERLRALAARFGGAPVIVLTAYAPAAQEPDRLGVAAVLRKPFDLDALVAEVDRVARMG